MAVKTPAQPTLPFFQRVGDPTNNRTDHVWFECDSGWKCCLCGALEDTPPPYPTRGGYTPRRFGLPLTDEERLLEPYAK